MNKELKNVLSKTEPSNTNVVWYHPTEGGIIPKVFRGGWQALIQGAAGDNTQVIEWSHTHNMNDYKDAGAYRIKGERTGNPMDDNLPIMNQGSGHTIDGILYVLDSSLPNGGSNIDDCTITQFLMLSNRVGGQEGDMYMRSAYGANKDSLTWKPWEKYQTNMEVGVVSDDATHDPSNFAPINTNGLNSLVDNGIYSGVYLTEEALKGDATKAQTFVMVVINNYFIAKADKTITQIKFAVATNGTYSQECRTLSADGFWSEWNNGMAAVTIVNDLTTDGADKALSAEMGKKLYQIATDTTIIYAIPVIYNQVPSDDIGADGDYALFIFVDTNQRLYKKINGAWTVFTDYKKVNVIAGNRIFHRYSSDQSVPFVEISTPILDAVLSTIRVEYTDIEPFNSMLYIWLEESTGMYRAYTYLNNLWRQIENNTTLSNAILKIDGDLYKFHYSTRSLEKLSSNRLVELLEDKVNQVYENTIYADLIVSKSGVMPGDGASNKEFYLSVEPSTTYKVKFKAQYTGQLSLYASTDGTDLLGQILGISNTDFTSEFTTYITTPENCHVLRTRTHKAGVTIDYISLYLESPVGEIVADVKERVEDIEEKLKVQPNDWQGKVISTYGDSVTALNGGDFNYPYDESTFGYKWALRVANYFQASSVKNRGIGGQRFNWNNHGGSLSWVNTETGEYVDRNDSYNYDNYIGNVTIPSNCTPIRGALSSWLRITSMYPESIKDTIDVVLVMAHNDMGFDATIDIEFVDGDSTDTEWANSSYYQTYGGDYNINTVKGGIASTVMKLQAWMPNAVIVLMTPISGKGEQGELNIGLTSRMTEIVDAVKDVHNLMSIPCIDVYGSCGINGLNRTRYITDTIHPYSVDGSKMVARAVIGGMKSIIPNML